MVKPAVPPAMPPMTCTNMYPTPFIQPISPRRTSASVTAGLYTPPEMWPPINTCVNHVRVSECRGSGVWRFTYHSHKDCPNGERANNCRPQQRDDVNEEEGADELHQVRCNVHHGGCAGLLLVNHAAGRNARHQCLRCGHAMLRGVATAGKPHLAEPIIIRKVGVHGARLVASANEGRMEDERSENARARASHKLGVRDAAFCCQAIRTDDWTASRQFECVMTNTIVTTLRIR